MIQEVNKNLLSFFHSFIEYGWIEISVTLFADLPIFFLPVFLVGAWIHYSCKNQKDKKHSLLYIFYSTIIAILISIFIQSFVDIERPETHIAATGKLILDHIPDTSFPSDHSAVAFAFVFALFFSGYKKTGYIFLVFAILMVVSRVIVGVHWPFDILAGMIVGLIGAFISFKFLKKQKLVKSFNECIIKIGNIIKL